MQAARGGSTLGITEMQEPGGTGMIFYRDDSGWNVLALLLVVLVVVLLIGGGVIVFNNSGGSRSSTNNSNTIANSAPANRPAGTPGR